MKINDLNNNLLTVFTEISKALVVKLLACKCLSLGLDECSEILLYWRLLLMTTDITFENVTRYFLVMTHGLHKLPREQTFLELPVAMHENDMTMRGLCWQDTHSKVQIRKH